MHRELLAVGQWSGARNHPRRRYGGPTVAPLHGLWPGARRSVLRGFPLPPEFRLPHVRARAGGGHTRNGHPAMDVLSTILACSLYLEDDSIVRAIAESNSQSNPYFVLDASIDRIE